MLLNWKENTLSIEHTVAKVGTFVHKQDRTKNDSSYAKFPITNKIAESLRVWRTKQIRHRDLQPNDYNDSDYICLTLKGTKVLDKQILSKKKKGYL